jgi:hypothetical protein
MFLKIRGKQSWRCRFFQNSSNCTDLSSVFLNTAAILIFIGNQTRGFQSKVFQDFQKEIESPEKLFYCFEFKTSNRLQSAQKLCSIASNFHEK